MVSTDQLAQLGLDRVAVVGVAQVGRTIRPWLELHTSMHGGAFGSTSRDRGGLLAPTLGAAVQSSSRSLRPWLALDCGPAVTGTAVRPFLALTLGLDMRAEANISVGPAIGYGRVVQWNRPRHTTDASYIWLGLSMRFRFDRRREPAPPPAVRKVRVAERGIRLPPEPLSPPDNDEVLRLIERAVPTMTRRTELLAPVLFKFDADTLEPIGVAMLHEVAQQLSARPDIRLLEIQGYADARGSLQYNQSLSQRRAERVREWLIEHGVAAERLRVAAHGASAPVEASAEERAYEQNRRVIFRVIEQGEAP